MSKIQLLFLFPHFFLMANAQEPFKKLTGYVNPFIGTQAMGAGLSGSNFPGATTPFGMVQLSPDTRDIPEFPASGYDYDDKIIAGFSHTHLSGTGLGDLFDLLIMPSIGKIKTNATFENKLPVSYSSSFSHKNESASPGYYQVFLNDYGINAELTATEHVGVHRYTFPKSEEANIVLDLNHSVNKKAFWNPVAILSAQLKIIDQKTIEGYRIMTTWGEGIRKVYFRIELSKPFKKIVFENSGQLYTNSNAVNGTAVKGVLSFNTQKGEEVIVKVGLSAVSNQNALLNLISEVPHFDFNQVKLNALDLWEKELGKIKIDATENQKFIFYTALYHTLIQPNNIADVNGEYPANDATIGMAPDNKHFTTFSLWDTYRAAHPLYTLVQPQKSAQFINSMLRQYKRYGYLPVWQLWGLENFCMIGSHAVPVIADAVLKEIEGIDPQEAYEAIKGTLTHDHPEFLCAVWDKFGYVPQDIHSESVSFTLEMAYDDWCAAQLAKKLDKVDDYNFFLKRAGNFKNLFDKETGFFRAKNKQGSWVNPFDPLNSKQGENAFFTEGNAWHYLFYVPQNIPGLSGLLGGKIKFAAKLDSFFNLKIDEKNRDGNVSGLIGLYAQGNEPSHHVAYLYNFVDQAWKSQLYVSRILNEMYKNSPAGYSGNDDCGQMSAWYIFSSIGFYPVNPSSGIYIFGSPSLKQAELILPNGKKFTVKTINSSAENIYIQSAKLNEKDYTKTYITHHDISNGGELTFVMGNKPNKTFAANKEDAIPALGY